MNVGSLFTGIGGFDLGLERAGMRVAWQCEADAFCRRVLARHWPDVPCYPDVRELRGDSVEPVDVLCGGFPCQDISLAGRGAGIDGERSGLWAEYARLVRELRPRYVVVENVSALLARGLGRVLGDLAACGYDAEWDCIPASAVGAPHRRDRIWLVAYPCGARRRENSGSAPGYEGANEGWSAEHDHVAGGDGEGDGARVVADAEREGELQPRWPLGEVGRWSRHGGEPRNVADPDEFGRPQGLCESAGRDERPGTGNTEWRGELQDPDGGTVEPWRVGGRAAQAGGPEWWAVEPPEWWAVEPPVGRVAHGVPDRLDQLAALGNALVPQIAQWIGERLMAWEAACA